MLGMGTPAGIIMPPGLGEFLTTAVSPFMDMQGKETIFGIRKSPYVRNYHNALPMGYETYLSFYPGMDRISCNVRFCMRYAKWHHSNHL